MTQISSWFVQQLALPATDPKRVFSMGGSDYSSRVIKWPNIKITAQGFNPRDVKLSLANNDGHFNLFYQTQYTMVKSATLQLGFTHPTSGDELVTLYSGQLKNVIYSREALEVRLQDKFYDLGTRKIGDSDTPVEISSVIPTDIAWTQLTCYGGLSNVASVNNPDIDYASFLELAAVFSGDSVLCAARYEGMKVSKALRNLAIYTDSAIYNGGDGKIYFARFVEMSSLDATLTSAQYTDVRAKIDDITLINRQHVYGDYDVTSNFWKINVLDESSSSVNSYGLHEDILSFKDIWFVDSASCINMAARRVLLFDEPPRDLKVRAQLSPMYRDVGETMRIDDVFLNITSADPFRIMESEININDGSTRYRMTTAAALNAFFLDVNYLDEFDAFGNEIADTLVIVGGSGYDIGNILTVSGGTSTYTAKIYVENVDGGNNITSASMYQGGNYTVVPSNPVSVTAGPATFNLTWVTGGDPRLL